MKTRTIVTPKGFLFSTVEAAINKPGRKDFALIVSEVEATMVGVFTSNAVKAAPVRLDIERIRRGRGRAIAVNSGNANACTGRQGMADARETAALVADALCLRHVEVYVCSTGVIGSPMPMARVRSKVPELAVQLGQATLQDVVAAIMTTDTFPKLASRIVVIAGKKVTITGICKGAGMICPNMATMLCFVMTDALIGHTALQHALRAAVDVSFNSLTIDGDMSTNDTVLIMANGMAGNAPVTEGSLDFSAFSRGLLEVCSDLAVMIARDGEGATRFVTVEVKNARSDQEAREGALAIANSLLVKTAIYGNDANWGRLMAALGYSGIAIKEARVDIVINGVKVAAEGLATGKDAEAGRRMHATEVAIAVNLRLGSGRAKVLTCDLTEDYIKINANYRT